MLGDMVQMLLGRDLRFVNRLVCHFLITTNGKVFIVFLGVFSIIN
jgi:hypothetical protein